MTDLYLPVRGIYFDAMQRGDKTEEYRLVTPWWEKRLVGREYARIILTRGYPRKDDCSRRLIVPWRGYTIRTLTHPHFGDTPVDVFAIRVDIAASTEVSYGA